MNSDSVEWSVDVQRTSVFVTFGQGDEHEHLVLSGHHVGVLREQLRLASLLADRNQLTENAEAADAAWFASNAVAGDFDSDRARLAEIKRTAGILSGAFYSTRQASPEYDVELDDPNSSSGLGSRTEGRFAGAGLDQLFRGLYGDLSLMPLAWRIEAVGQEVEIEVPASSAGRLFRLTASEALAAGIALIHGSERARQSEGRRR
jgi:hypothetical protein